MVYVGNSPPKAARAVFLPDPQKPKGFVKIRHYGFLANRNRAKNLKTIRMLMGLTARAVKTTLLLAEMIQKIVGFDITRCPCCNTGKMHFFVEITQYRARAPNSLLCAAG